MIIGNQQLKHIEKISITPYERDLAEEEVIEEIGNLEPEVI